MNNGSSSTGKGSAVSRGNAVGASLRKEPFSLRNLLVFLIPAGIAFLLSFALKSDAGNFLLWWVTLFLFGVAAFPLAASLFAGFTGRGYGFSKVIGILVASFVLWTLSYAGILAFSRVFIFITLIATAAVSWGIPYTRKSAIEALSSPRDLYSIAWEESIFVLALFVWCLVKGTRPEINGEEKFMDFAFLNALLRTNTLPCPDPWLAGKSINYYYYGQYIYAFIAKLTGIKSGVAYTLSMCTAFALAFTMSYSLGHLFLDGATQKGLKIPSFLKIPAGLLSAFAVTIFGNSHAFFYYEGSVGNALLKLFSSMGINVGRTDNFFYPDSTRFIGHNPDSQIIDTATNTVVKAGDYTIHEFPCYSYLLGDLHAHVVSLMIVMLIVGVLFVLYFRAKPPEGGELLLPSLPAAAPDFSLPERIKQEARNILRPEILVTGVLLGLATMCNYWDFLIYFIVASMALLIYQTRISRSFLSMPGFILFLVEIGLILLCYIKFSSSPFVHVILQVVVLAVCLIATTMIPCALSRTSLGMSFLFSLASLSSLSFNANFDMISNSLAKTETTSSVYQFLILWGTHLFFALLLIAMTLAAACKKGAREKEEGENPVSRFLSRMNPADLFMSGIAVVSFLLLAAPEIFYVRDIYGGSYKRSNTMFKFTFEAFVLLSLVMIYALFRFFSVRVRTRGGNRAVAFFSVVLSLALIIPGTYPTVAINQRTGDITLNESFTLDGTKALETRDSPQLPTTGGGDMLPYANAIDWLNQNVTGTPVICEAYGNSYTDNCVVSAYTGLPTIIGWQTHEWLWRFQGIVNEKGELVSNPSKPDVWNDILTPRHNEVTAIYQAVDTVESLSTAKSILAKYNVQYLIVGDLERAQYPTINDEILKSFGDVVFTSGSLYIVRIA